MTFGHSRRGESQLVLVLGMVLMLIAGVVVDRMFLLEVLPTSHIREFLHLQATESAPLTPVTSTPQGQGTFTTTPKAPSRAAPRYAGSAGVKIGDAVEMVSGPTFSSGYITGVIRNKSGKQLGLVRVDFALYDASGNNVDTAADMFGPLGAGETWRYKTGIYDSDVTSYKLVNFEAY